MRSGASHPGPHCFVDLSSRLRRLGAARRWHRSDSGSPARADETPHLPVPLPDHDSVKHNPATSALASSPTRSRGPWRRPQCPGQPDAHAFPISPGNSPSRIPGPPLVRRDHRSAALRRSHVFGEPNVPQIVSRSNEKTFCACAEAVEDETSLWTVEENCEQRKRGEI
jgi:hypothetical protein